MSQGSRAQPRRFVAVEFAQRLQEVGAIPEVFEFAVLFVASTWLLQSGTHDFGNIDDKVWKGIGDRLVAPS